MTRESGYNNIYTQTRRFDQPTQEERYQRRQEPEPEPPPQKAFRWRKWAFRAFAVLFLIYLTVWIAGYAFLLPGYHRVVYTDASYRQTLATIYKGRLTLSERYASSNDSLANAVQNRAARYFQANLSQRIFPYWYGTFWGFNGISTKPGKGRIACGHFVTTVLRDMGCKLEYRRLATLASEEMIRNLVDKPNIRHYIAAPIDTFVAALQKRGNGVYIVGLDKHTGFLLVENGELDFVHSSGRPPFCVLREKAVNSTTLRKSRYKVVGELTEDNRFMKGWLNEI